jgi:hypothetical protein
MDWTKTHTGTAPQAPVEGQAPHPFARQGWKSAVPPTEEELAEREKAAKAEAKEKPAASSLTSQADVKPRAEDKEKPPTAGPSRAATGSKD